MSQNSASNEEVGRATIKASAETSGYLGPTSFAATVQHGDLDDPKVGSEAKSGMGVVDSDQLRLGVQVLMALPTEQACHDLLEWYLDTVVVVASHKLTRRLTLKAFWHSYGHLLQGQRNRGDLEIIARELFHNGSVSLKQIDDPMEWIESFSGINTRWEVLGLLFVAFAYAILSGPEHILNIGFGVKKVDRDGLVGQMKKCVERSIELCRGSLNLLVCNLLYWNALLETVLSGDSSKWMFILHIFISNPIQGLSVWRLHNDAVGTCVAFGLHIYQGTSQITLYTEQMKSIAACMFWLDKDLSTFTGRPPALSHRYYSCPPPLDINDNTLICGGAELDREIQSLDENGWNTQGRVFEATIVRMMLMTSLIQEEIMEMFLGNQAQWSLQRQE